MLSTTFGVPEFCALRREDEAWTAILEDDHSVQPHDRLTSTECLSSTVHTSNFGNRGTGEPVACAEQLQLAKVCTTTLSLLTQQEGHRLRTLQGAAKFFSSTGSFNAYAATMLRRLNSGYSEEIQGTTFI